MPNDSVVVDPLIDHSSGGDRGTRNDYRPTKLDAHESPKLGRGIRTGVAAQHHVDGPIFERKPAHQGEPICVVALGFSRFTDHDGSDTVISPRLCLDIVQFKSIE